MIGGGGRKKERGNMPPGSSSAGSTCESRIRSIEERASVNKITGRKRGRGANPMIRTAGHYKRVLKKRAAPDSRGKGKDEIDSRGGRFSVESEGIGMGASAEKVYYRYGG